MDWKNFKEAFVEYFEDYNAADSFTDKEIREIYEHCGGEEMGDYNFEEYFQELVIKHDFVSMDEIMHSEPTKHDIVVVSFGGIIQSTHLFKTASENCGDFVKAKIKSILSEKDFKEIDHLCAEEMYQEAKELWNDQKETLYWSSEIEVTRHLDIKNVPYGDLPECKSYEQR